jgi:hypothetical protein
MPKNFWNVVSIVLPLVTTGLSLLWMKGNRPTGGNLGAALAPVFVVGMLLWAVCVLGTVSATVALIRGEDKVWLSLIGLLANLMVVIGGLLFILPKD